MAADREREKNVGVAGGLALSLRRLTVVNDTIYYDSSELFLSRRAECCAVSFTRVLPGSKRERTSP